MHFQLFIWIPKLIYKEAQGIPLQMAIKMVTQLVFIYISAFPNWNLSADEIFTKCIFLDWKQKNGGLRGG